MCIYWQIKIGILVKRVNNYIFLYVSYIKVHLCIGKLVIRIFIYTCVLLPFDCICMYKYIYVCVCVCVRACEYIGIYRYKG